VNNGLDVPIEPWRARSEPAATVLNVWQVSGWGGSKTQTGCGGRGHLCWSQW